jgi:tetratricopeptide (TPR) repeat protein
MPARSIVLAALACFLPSLAAQTVKPVSSPAAIATKPDLTGEAVVVEKSTMVLRYARDGSSVRTLTVVAHMLSDAGVREIGIITFPFSSLTETLTFDFVRVRKASGEVIETPVEDAQEVPMPVTQAAPMYSDLRTKQLPVRSLSVGDTLEYQLTIKGTNADSPGAFWHPMSFSGGLPVKEETVELRVPRDLSVLVKSKKVQPVVSDEGDERVYRWKHETASEYPKKQDKDKAAQVELVQEMYDPDIAMTSFHSWAEVGAWYRGLIKDRAVPDAAIQAKADELTRGLTTDDAKVDALYHYVATQYRYIAVSFGIGRLQPHTAAEVFRNQYGDCKDKHTLLQAMLAAEKIEAEPVLIGSGARVNEALPMPSQFNHMITLVKLKDREVWLDSTPEVAPSRMLMAGLRDKLALAIPAAGDAKLVRTEAALPFPSFTRETITGKLEKGGVLTAHFDLTLRGDAEVMYRSAFHQAARAQWQELEQRISSASGFAGDVSGVDASMPEKTAEPFHVSWDYTRKDFGDWENRRFPGMSTWFETKIADDATAPDRAMVIDPTGEAEVKVTLTLPEGYTVTVPSDVKRSTDFAEYTSTYKLKDRTLEMDRTMRYKVRELPVSEFGAYREFLKTVSDDAEQMLQLVALEEPSTNAKPVTTAEGTPAAAPPKETGILPMEAVTLVQLAHEEREKNQLSGARSSLDQAKALNDHQEGLWAEYGALDSFTNPTLAISDFKREIEQHPDSVVAYEKLSALYSSDGMWPQAERTIQAWSKVAPADPKPLTSLGELRMAQQRNKEAETLFAAAVLLGKQQDRLKLRLARAQLKAGETDAGKTTLLTVIAATDDVDLLNDAALELSDANVDLPAGEAASRKAIEKLEKRSTATVLTSATNQDFATMVLLATNWDTMGWIYYKERKLPQAESYARSAWMLSPEATIGDHLGAIYDAEGKLADALTTYRQTLLLMQNRYVPPADARKGRAMQGRVAALRAAGVRERPGVPIPTGSDEFKALRTYTIASPLDGVYASADFLFLMSNNHVDDVCLIRGDDAFKKGQPALLAATYRAPLPIGSKARVLRRGYMMCAPRPGSCELVLSAPNEARMGD